TGAAAVTPKVSSNCFTNSESSISVISLNASSRSSVAIFAMVSPSSACRRRVTRDVGVGRDVGGVGDGLGGRTFVTCRVSGGCVWCLLDTGCSISRHLCLSSRCRVSSRRCRCFLSSRRLGSGLRFAALLLLECREQPCRLRQRRGEQPD